MLIQLIANFLTAAFAGTTVGSGDLFFKILLIWLNL